MCHDRLLLRRDAPRSVPGLRPVASACPVVRVPPPFDAWVILDYEGVKRALSDHETFSSRVPAPRNWFLFSDPPSHTKSRALISRAFTPRSIAGLEPRIRELSRRLLDSVIDRGEMDLAVEFAVPLPMMVIAEMIGIPAAGLAAVPGMERRDPEAQLHPLGRRGAPPGRSASSGRRRPR